MSDTNPLILVVDDNEMNRDMLSRRLQRQGYEIVMAEDGERALAVIQEQRFDLVLLDIMMPTLSGYEVLERIKSNDDTKHLPVIMISAVDDLDSVVKCIEMGAEDYLFKPFNPVLLKARVESSLTRSRAGINPKDLEPHINAMKAEIAALLSGIGTVIEAGQAARLERLKHSLDEIEAIVS